MATQQAALLSKQQLQGQGSQSNCPRRCERKQRPPAGTPLEGRKKASAVSVRRWLQLHEALPLLPSLVRLSGFKLLDVPARLPQRSKTAVAAEMYPLCKKFSFRGAFRSSVRECRVMFVIFFWILACQPAPPFAFASPHKKPVGRGTAVTALQAGATADSQELLLLGAEGSGRPGTSKEHTWLVVSLQRGTKIQTVAPFYIPPEPNVLWDLTTLRSADSSTFKFLKCALLEREDRDHCLHYIRQYSDASSPGKKVVVQLDYMNYAQYLEDVELVQALADAMYFFECMTPTPFDFGKQCRANRRAVYDPGVLATRYSSFSINGFIAMNSMQEEVVRCTKRLVMKIPREVKVYSDNLNIHLASFKNPTLHIGADGIVIDDFQEGSRGASDSGPGQSANQKFRVDRVTLSSKSSDQLNVFCGEELRHEHKFQDGPISFFPYRNTIITPFRPGFDMTKRKVVTVTTHGHFSAKKNAAPEKSVVWTREGITLVPVECSNTVGQRALGDCARQFLDTFFPKNEGASAATTDKGAEEVYVVFDSPEWVLEFMAEVHRLSGGTVDFSSFKYLQRLNKEDPQSPARYITDGRTQRRTSKVSVWDSFYDVPGVLLKTGETTCFGVASVKFDNRGVSVQTSGKYNKESLDDFVNSDDYNEVELTWKLRAIVATRTSRTSHRFSLRRQKKQIKIPIQRENIIFVKQKEGGTNPQIFVLCGTEETTIDLSKETVSLKPVVLQLKVNHTSLIYE